MKFFPNDIRAIVAMDENGNFSQERADAFAEFMNEEDRIARGRGWAEGVNAVARSFSDASIASKVSERGHGGNFYLQS